MPVAKKARVEVKTVGELRAYLADIPDEIEVFTTGENYGHSYPGVEVEDVGEHGGSIGPNEGLRDGFNSNVRPALVISD